MPVEPARGAAEGRGNCQDPCYPMLTTQMKRCQRWREVNEDRSNVHNLIYRPLFSDDHGFRPKEKDSLEF